jgi:hypothetical protein
MRPWIAATVAGFALAALDVAAAPAVETVQGLYEGTAGGSKAEARVVALGKGAFKIFVRLPKDGGVDKAELEGKIEGDALAFAGKAADAAWSGAWADGAIRGKAADGALELKRVVKESPTLGAKPPDGAVVIIPLDGKVADEAVKKPGKDGAEQAWKVAEDGGVEVTKGGIDSKRTVDGSFKLHVEFKNPLMPEARDQGRGNSGCYLPNGDEIQVLDSFGMSTYTGGGCGGIYKYKDPDTFDVFSLASLPPGQWQTYDVEYRVEKKDGKPAGKPRVTVLHNGIKIHDNFELRNGAKPGRFHFQDHGNPVQYRNIWFVVME